MYKHIDYLIERYPKLNICREDIYKAYSILEESYSKDKKLLIAGNGGSAADSEHIAGELMKRFKLSRTISKEFIEKLEDIDYGLGKELSCKLERGLMAIPLVSFEALSTACTNDVDGKLVFAQQVYGLGRTDDVFLAISTSGNSENVILAAVVAKALGMKVISLTGIDGGRIERFSDVTIKVPEKETYLVQELHLPVYHCICLMIEERFFGKEV